MADSVQSVNNCAGANDSKLVWGFHSGQIHGNSDDLQSVRRSARRIVALDLAQVSKLV